MPPPDPPHRPALLGPPAAAFLALCLLAGLALAVGPPAELLPNGGFEHGAAGWTAHQGDLAVVTSPARTGGHAGLLTSSGAAGIAWLESGMAAVVPGAPYTLSGAVYFTSTSVAAAQLALLWYESLTSTQSLFEPVVTAPLAAPAADWQSWPTRVATAPPGMAAARVQARIALTPGTAATALFDDLSLVGEPGAPLPTPTITRTPAATPTPDGPPPTTARPGDVLVSEVQAHPASGGNAGEWLELHNRTAATVTLRGWSIADNVGADPLPTLDLSPGAFAVVAADDGVFRALFSAFAGRLITVPSGLIGNGLADGGDRLSLFDGAGAVIDALSYGSDSSILDPPPPAAAAGRTLERRPADHDTDTAGDFASSSPTPGQAPAPITPTPTPSPTPTWPVGAVRINEIMPAPHDVDWDGDGQAGSGDEWVELYNAAGFAVDLGGWRLDDAAGAGSKPYTVPPGAAIPALGYRLFFQRDTGLALNNDGDTVRLLHPDDSPAGEVAYGSTLYDHSFSRTAAGAWSRDYAPSPGGPNIAPTPTATPVPPGAPPTPAVVPIGQARGAARDAPVAIEGRLSVPPGVFGRRVAYVEDAVNGMRIQHYGRDLPALAEGDSVHVEGRLTAVYGEVTLNVREIIRMGAGPAVAPAALATGSDWPWWEGRLVRVAGLVTGWDSGDIWLDDGSGPAQVRLRESAGVERPELAMGQFLSAAGVVGRSGNSWFIVPRWQRDLSSLPARLPDTGSR